MDLGLVEYVVDKHDVPEPGLRTGDRGAFVEIHLPDGIEVEFVTADGHAQAQPCATRRLTESLCFLTGHGSSSGDMPRIPPARSHP
jgi:hypothetical protein